MYVQKGQVYISYPDIKKPKALNVISLSLPPKSLHVERKRKKRACASAFVFVCREPILFAWLCMSISLSNWNQPRSLLCYFILRYLPRLPSIENERAVDRVPVA